MNDIISNVDLRNKGEEVEQAALRAQRKEESRRSGRLGNITPVPDDQFKDIPPRFEETTEPLPSYAGTMAAAVAAAYGTAGLRSSEVEDVADLESKIGNEQTVWHGTAAESFDEFYLQPFNNCLDNQEKALVSLERAMLTYEKALEKRRQDVIEIGSRTVDALEDLGSSGAEAQLALAILGAGLTVAGGVASGGSLAIPLATAAVSTIAAVASNAGKIDGSTVNSVVESMYKALDDLDEDVNLKAKEIAKHLNDGKTSVQDQLGIDRSGSGKPDLLPREPDSTESAITSGDVPDPGNGDNPHDDYFEPPQVG